MILRVILVGILLLLIIRAVSTLVRGIAIGAGGQVSRRSPRAPVRLARDPVCGTHVAPRAALSLTTGGQTHYFCSDECRRKFSGKTA